VDSPTFVIERRDEDPGLFSVFEQVSMPYGKGANQLNDLTATLSVAIEAVTRASNIVREHVPLVVTTKKSARDMATDVDLSVENTVGGTGVGVDQHRRALILGRVVVHADEVHDNLRWAVGPGVSR
ncbi:MAG: hypothetical protein ACRDX9_15020, partial [Acidimicrobiia bacterium]